MPNQYTKNDNQFPDNFCVRLNHWQSRAIQEFLFSVGVKWISGHDKVLHKSKRYIYVLAEAITCSDTANNDPNIPNINFDDYFIVKNVCLSGNCIMPKSKNIPKKLLSKDNPIPKLRIKP
jgi:hypothetical protein